MQINKVNKLVGIILVLIALLFASLYFWYPSLFGFDTSYEIRGKFVGFQYGDYHHAVYKTIQGEIISTFMTTEGCFLALNKNEDLIILLVEEDVYIPEAGRDYTITVAKSIKTVDSNKRWTRVPGFGNEEYDQNERNVCEKIQSEFIYNKPSP